MVAVEMVVMVVVDRGRCGGRELGRCQTAVAGATTSEY